MAEHEQAIIIKKKKKGGHGGHHGGAWKVAYADFVTAMMAFFLVMWILGLSSSSKARIASFFREPGIFTFTGGKKVTVNDLNVGSMGHEGNGNGHVGMKASDDPNTKKYSQLSEADSTMREMMKRQAVLDSVASAKKIEETSVKLKNDLQKLAKDNPKMQQLLASVQLTMSDEGLRIELTESKENVFFQLGSCRLTNEAITILQKLAGEIGKLDNHVVLEGHTDSRQYPGSGGYSNWELSADRANAARRILENNGVWTGQITNVTGFADRRLRNQSNPFDVMNRRVSILVSHMKTAEIMNNMIEEKKKEAQETTASEHSNQDEHKGH